MSATETNISALKQRNKQLISGGVPYILESNPHPFLQLQRAKISDAD